MTLAPRDPTPFMEMEASNAEPERLRGSQVEQAGRQEQELLERLK